MRFLISAGPTREYLDTVRFLSNPSTGKMGYACAEAALRSGHEVVLVSGPVTLTAPEGLDLVKVISSQEMYQAVLKAFSACDCVIMAAAPCDYRPKHISEHKLRKSPSQMTLELERTHDILAELGQIKNKQILIGFAVQDRDARKNAQQKLDSKCLDAIILNSPSAFGADRSKVEILRKGHGWQSLGEIDKIALAEKIVALAQQLVAERLRKP